MQPTLAESNGAHIPPRSVLDQRIKVGPSPIHGLGMFATDFISPGEAIIQWGGRVLPLADLEHLKTQSRYDCSALSENSIIVFEPDDPVIHGNHSCDPNTWMESAITISSRRLIRSGDEITIDYAVLSDDPKWSMACLCGSGLCRKLIRGDDWRLRALQVRYSAHFSPYLAHRTIG